MTLWGFQPESQLVRKYVKWPRSWEGYFLGSKKIIPSCTAQNSPQSLGRNSTTCQQGFDDPGRRLPTCSELITTCRYLDRTEPVRPHSAAVGVWWSVHHPWSTASSVQQDIGPAPGSISNYGFHLCKEELAWRWGSCSPKLCGADRTANTSMWKETDLDPCPVPPTKVWSQRVVDLSCRAKTLTFYRKTQGRVFATSDQTIVLDVTQRS